MKSAKEILKYTIRSITKILAIVYLYQIIQVLFNLPDEITFWSCIAGYIYVVIMLNLIEWSMQK